MAEGIDVNWIGQRLRRVRKQRDLTLREVFDETGIPIPTLSRIERGAAKSLDSATLLALSEWMAVSVEELRGIPKSVKKHGKEIQETPDIVELHLRADKNLSKDTALALANLFRTAYEHYTQLQGKKD
jgi:transcriptional regulator with XRE-family HTH domain